MKILAFFILCLASAPSSASNMAPVPGNTGYCSGEFGICFEWRLAADSSTRLIAQGSEQGVDYSFYTVTDGRYEQLVRIYPVLRDSKRGGKLYWAYPESIQDVSIAPGEPPGRFMATYNHNLIDDGEVYSPDWQKRIPAVLFIGSTTQPWMRVKTITFEAVGLADLRNSAARP